MGGFEKKSEFNSATCLSLSYCPEWSGAVKRFCRVHGVSLPSNQVNLVSGAMG